MSKQITRKEQQAQKLWRSFNPAKENDFWADYEKLLKGCQNGVLFKKIRQKFYPHALAYTWRILFMLISPVICYYLLLGAFLPATGALSVFARFIFSLLIILFFLALSMLFMSDLKVFTVSETGLLVSGRVFFKPICFAWEDIRSVTIAYDYSEAGTVSSWELVIKTDEGKKKYEYHLAKSTHKLFAQALKTHSINLKTIK